MRKIGIVCMVLGALIALATGMMQRADWFLAERAASRLSEHVEWVVSCFWAGLALAGLGLVFLIRSFLVREEEATFADYLPEQAGQSGWVCPRCGSLNDAGAPACGGCGLAAPQAESAYPQPAESAPGWVCPRCGRGWSDDASVCMAFGYQRFY